MLEMEWLWSNEGEGIVKGDCKILAFGSWDNVVDTDGGDWKGIYLGSNIMQLNTRIWGKYGTSKWKSQSFLLTGFSS